MVQREEITDSIVAGIHRSISANQLTKFFSWAKKIIDDARDADLSENYRLLYDDYQRMLDFFCAGKPDPDRRKVMFGLRLRAHQLTDDLLPHVVKKCGGNNRDQAMAQIMSSGSEPDLISLVRGYVGQVHLQSQPFEAVDALVHSLDVCRIGNPRFVFDTVINNEDDSLPLVDRLYAVGAITHNVISRFDREIALEMLRSLCMPGVAAPVKGRIAAGVAATMFAHPERWQEDDELLYFVLRDDEDAQLMIKSLSCVVFYYFVILFSENIGSFIARHVDHERLTKLQQRVQERVERGEKAQQTEEEIDELREVFGLHGDDRDVDNPFVTWRMMGADLEYPAFSQMKRFRFFNATTNWYKPFCGQESSVAQNLSGLDAGLVEKFEKTFLFCESDKYSLVASQSGISNSDLSAIFAEYTYEGAEEVGVPTLLIDTDDKYLQDVVLTGLNFVKDLYRAYKLNGDHFGFNSLFTNQQRFLDSRLLVCFFANEALDNLGTLLVQNEMWETAEHVYRLLSARAEGIDANLLRKQAHCLMNMNARYADARELLKRAEIIDDGNVWTKAQLVRCSIELQDYKQTLYYLGELAECRELSHKELGFKADACFALKKYAEAAQAAEEAYKLEETEDLAYKLVQSYLFCGRCADAVRLIDKTCDNPASRIAYAIMQIIDDFAGHHSCINGLRYLFDSCGDRSFMLTNLDFYKEALLANGLSRGDFNLLCEIVSDEQTLARLFARVGFDYFNAAQSDEDDEEEEDEEEEE